MKQEGVGEAVLGWRSQVHLPAEFGYRSFRLLCAAAGYTGASLVAMLAVIVVLGVVRSPSAAVSVFLKAFCALNVSMGLVLLARGIHMLGLWTTGRLSLTEDAIHYRDGWGRVTSLGWDQIMALHEWGPIGYLVWSIQYRHPAGGKLKWLKVHGRKYLVGDARAVLATVLHRAELVRSAPPLQWRGPGWRRGEGH